MSVHCPFCNTTNVSGQGLVVYDNSPLVQYHCASCGKLFFASDRRNEKPVQMQRE